MPSIRYTAPDARPLWVGIDPGERTGLAIWDGAAQCFRRIVARPFWGAVEALDALGAIAPCPVAGVVIEDSRGLPLYQRHRGLPRAARDRAARSVGRIDVQTDLLVQRCEALGLPVVLAEPSRRKLDHAKFARLTGHEGRTNQHARDAGLLVFGRAPGRTIREMET